MTCIIKNYRSSLGLKDMYLQINNNFRGHFFFPFSDFFSFSDFEKSKSVSVLEIKKLILTCLSKNIFFYVNVTNKLRDSTFNRHFKREAKFKKIMANNFLELKKNNSLD